MLLRQQNQVNPKEKRDMEKGDESKSPCHRTLRREGKVGRREKDGKEKGK
jgi:hypothetical protein